MTGLDTAPITAVCVVGNTKLIWCVAIDVIAGGSSLRGFGDTLITITTAATKC